jgi:hypothetical protein
VSNFLKNLARRSAGLPLAAECRPTPAPVFGGSFESGAGLSEVTTETVGSQVEAPAAPRSFDAAAPPQVQRSVAEQNSRTSIVTAAIRPGSTPATNARTGLRPVSSLEVVSSEPSASLVRVDTTAQPAAFEIAANDSAFTARAEPAHVQTVLAPRRDLSAVVNPPATTSPRREGQEPAWPETSVEEQRESAPDVKLAVTNNSIRPALTDPTLPFQFPRIPTTSQQPVFKTPIEVRIGRVEVRGAPPVQAPTPATPAPSAPLGFASYHRLRRYRS